MDQQGQGPPPSIGDVANTGQVPIGASPYPPSQIGGPPPAIGDVANTGQVPFGASPYPPSQIGGPPPAIGDVANTGQVPYGASPYPPSRIGGAPSYVPMVGGMIQPPNRLGGTQFAPLQLTSEQTHQLQEELTYQQAYQLKQQQLQQRLQTFWANQYQEIEKITDFKHHNLPLARIKKIMKADDEVNMISAEAPILFARACEMFIMELTLRSWNHTEENKRKVLQKNDVVAAVNETETFDFLVDTVPREEPRHEMFGVGSSTTGPMGSIPTDQMGPGDAIPPHCHMPPQPGIPQVGNPGMFLGNPTMDPNLSGQQQGLPYADWDMCHDTSEQQQQPPSDH
ncbi:hypothetical protein SAY87_032121 [Trapa incisa]|uniref:Transcription factor CBF/NF-Y/archaeal histone domain-containing protein n=1 Tax=Trapa incisa TaxID=236973 RepID=A0AAN7QLQ3_9MYRT|nr:hypothetical protein SAY87_032121 [Trapa incisa]